MLWFNEVILMIMCLFMVLGAVDHYILNQRLSLGKQFHEAFMMMGPLALAMVGIISLAPILADVITPFITPIYQWFGADPSMFASTILAIDMGAYPLANSLALSNEAAIFSWALLGTMMGPTIVFTIPVALTVITKQDRPYFAQGILIGLVTVPIGCLIGGWVAGYEWFWMIRNLLPSIIFAFLIGVGLWLFTKATIRLFAMFGKGIELIIITGLVAITIETLTGFVVIPGMAPLEEGVAIVGRITVTLAGAYPLVAFINQRGERMFVKWGRMLGVNTTAITGFIASMAHSLPMLVVMEYMDKRGKVMNAAFAVSGAFVVGSHFAFVAGVNKEMIFAVMVGKLTAGILAVFIAWMVTKPEADEL